MKVALIPPRGLENYALRSKFHLALAIPELMSRRTYGGMYARLSHTGDFVVLDNGLAEGKPATVDELMSYAKAIRAKEVVLPDVMKAASGTIGAVKAFFKGTVSLDYDYMAVVQGQSQKDFFKCAEEFAKLPFIRTLGIPRHMLTTLNQQAARIDFAHVVNEKYPKRFELHFLGTNPTWVSEVRHTSKYAPFVRSVDTSMPFNYAIAGELLGINSKQITRPNHYFGVDWSHKIDGYLLRSNIQILMEWAGATNTRTETRASKLRSVSTP